MADYQFKLDIFEGPLDLLLHLIKEQKMDIYDIPIAAVTQQYLQYIEMMQDLNLEVAGDYLVMAAELARIKSKTLLPPSDTGEDKEEEGEDPREELTRRLLEYQKYKEAAFELRKREYERQQIFTRAGPAEVETEETGALVDANVFDLLSAFQSVLKNKTLREDYEVKIATLSVFESLERILETLNASESVTFASLFTTLDTKSEVIVTFMALLELIRLRLVQSQQTSQFGAIRIYLAADKEEQEAALRNYNEANSPTA